ncbi:DUF6642 family protein [Aquiflexum lacus]|uniref:DUF6642 family protein n=1 Tax=Aquiflexum lacus TaxID=2483805 RepID=UPI001894B5E7|nr:DUF6642 family protein [Aquiflexum lacus]
MKTKIFCLEGEWHSKDLRDQSTVETYLRFLKETFGIDYLFRKVNTRESLFKYLELLGRYSKKQYKDYSIIYLAFHGDHREIFLDDVESVEIDELLDIKFNPLQNRIVHFGSCRTLKLNFRDLEYFWTKSKTKAVSGFTKNVDFLEASIFDIAYLYKLSTLDQKGKVYNHIKTKYERHSKDLGFVYIDNYNPKSE